MKTKKQTISIPIAKPRNPFGTSALMRKGGKHQKTESAQRQQRRVELKKSTAGMTTNFDMDGL